MFHIDYYFWKNKIIKDMYIIKKLKEHNIIFKINKQH